MRAAYLASLLLSGGGLTLVDRRWRLVFWHDARRAGLVVGTGVAVLLAADLVGIALGLFFRAPTRIMTGLLLAPDSPDGALLDLTVPRRLGPGRPGLGGWADAGRGTPVQVAAPGEPRYPAAD